ncbi:MAG: ABC transporter permease, partial [Bacteroidota bacterium]
MSGKTEKQENVYSPMIRFIKKQSYSYQSPGKIAWSRFKKNHFSCFGLIYLLLMFAIALLGYLIIPDSTPSANKQFLELTTRRPGFSIQMLKIRKNITDDQQSWIKTMFMGKKETYNYAPVDSIEFKDSLLLAHEYSEKKEEKYIREYNPIDVVYAINRDKPVKFNNDEISFIDIENKRHTVSYEKIKQIIKSEYLVKKTFPLGTDLFGRDLLSRLVIGARISLSVGFIAVFISLVIGLTLGSIAGYFRGWIDDIIMWLINVVWSVPTLLMVIAITLVIGKGFWQIFLAVGLTMWVEVARVVRGQIISVREKEYVEAAKALGFPSKRIIIKHILPNVINPVIIISAANFASAILIEAGLSFLGIGVQPPMPSWGTMIKEHYGYILIDKGYLAILPGIAIMLTVLSFTLIGNGLRDA